MFEGDIEGEEIDRKADKNEKKHVGAQGSIGRWVDKVVLRVFIRTPDNTSGINHRDIKIGSLCAVHGCGLRLVSAPQWCFFWLFEIMMEMDPATNGSGGFRWAFKRHTLDYHFPNPSAQIDLGHS